MPQEGKISFLGLATWNSNLFADMNWPDPFLPTTVDDEEVDPVLSKEAFLDELYSQTAELEVIYPRPDFMQRLIGSWSKTRLPVWNELWKTTQYSYNPIENYDRIEDGTDMDTHSGTDTYGNTLARTGTDTVTDTPDLLVSEGAYDANTADPVNGLAPFSHQGGEAVSETEYGSTDTTNGSTIHGHKITTKHDLHVHGNIGTVTTQKMITEQREIVSFNFYEKMIRDFIERFCILVY